MHRFLIASLFCIATIEGSIPKDKITDILDFAYDTINVPGFIVGVVNREDDAIFPYGEIKKGTGIKPRGDTIFQIGSVSKVFTTEILAQLVVDGKIRLTDPWQKYAPSSVKIPDYEGREILIVDMATHTSGLPRLPDIYIDNPKVDIARDPYSYLQTEDFYQWVKSFKLKVKPGTHYEYSNTSFGFLGDIVARVENLSYMNVLNKYINEPLGLKDTVVKLTDEQKQRKATGYYEGKELDDWYFAQIQQGSGGLYSTADDLIKFMKASLGYNPKFVPANIVAHAGYVLQSELDNPLDVHNCSALALGWEVLDAANGMPSIIHKSGMTGNFTCWMFLAPGKKTGVVIIANSQFPYIYEMGMHVLATLLEASAGGNLCNRP